MAKKQKNPGVKGLRKLVGDTLAAREKLVRRAEKTQRRIAALGERIAVAEGLLADAVEARHSHTGADGVASAPAPPKKSPAKRTTTTAAKKTPAKRTTTAAKRTPATPTRTRRTTPRA